MKKNNKGFTLMEILAVVIILGILLIIAIPAVSKYILNSDKSSYAADIIAIAETAKGEYDMKEYGSFLKENQLMIVPLQYITLEKGDSTKSPFGDYVTDLCYAIIVPERNGYQMYINMVDENGMGVSMKSYNELNKESIQDGIQNMVTPYISYNSSDNKLNFKGTDYKKCGERQIKKEEYENASVLIMCK
jgi:prepilin-type N-terminal cleavage/methylation domain-containing protein